VLYIRIDKYPEIRRELKKIMAELDLDSYVDFLKMVCDLYREYPYLFREYASSRSRFVY